MPEPLREQIWLALADRLRSIQQSNGYRTDLRRVSRRLEFLDEINEFPVLLLLPAYDQDADLYQEATLQGTADAWLGLEVRLYVQASDAVEPITQLERLEADIGKALMASLTLGLDFVLGIERSGGREGDEMPQANAYRAWRAVNYRVRYQYSEGAE